MLKSTQYGLANFKVGNYEAAVSHLSDVPMDLMECFIDNYRKGIGAAPLDGEGLSICFILKGHSIYLIENKSSLSLYDCSGVKVDDLVEELISDIEDHMTQWEEWMCFREEAVDLEEDYLWDARVERLKETLETLKKLFSGSVSRKRNTLEEFA